MARSEFPRLAVSSAVSIFVSYSSGSPLSRCAGIFGVCISLIVTGSAEGTSKVGRSAHVRTHLSDIGSPAVYQLLMSLFLVSRSFVVRTHHTFWPTLPSSLLRIHLERLYLREVDPLERYQTGRVIVEVVDTIIPDWYDNTLTKELLV